jgi:hypothetical protein
MGGCLLSSFLLFNIKYVRHLMAIWCICFMSVMISFLGILGPSNSRIDCSWMAPLTLVVIMMREFTCHRVVLNVCMSGLILVAFSMWVVLGNFPNLCQSFSSLRSLHTCLIAHVGSYVGITCGCPTTMTVHYMLWQ